MNQELTEEQEIRALPILITRYKNQYPYFTFSYDEELGFFHAVHLGNRKFFIVASQVETFEELADIIAVQQTTSNIPLLVDFMEVNLLTVFNRTLKTVHRTTKKPKQKKSLLGAFH
ncbi:hypothetical protein [Testudinibacter sp. TR-2022]|uniref:hypothetical protein n=1 Tax=Testudinibacter sp. TR-2022 TaxID=2585029 RepID=UPI001118C3EE|nr:hypothetical protein [Testudinibacter sp. TR-2022]TNH07975.1 hypothetical protein FHQ30_03525 [Pasteurellaceae bacterium Phil11]TNH23191.1 hypothetical protein FHQ27_11745 [Testudinibacter sp. TR-2022]TNH23873.1 hypothetical protein FHQ29_04620 [Testudinibacter sp. TR-2022]